MSAQITAEQARILRAVRDGRLRTNEHARYLIDGEERPARRERERARQRGLFSGYGSVRIPYALTDKGRAALEAYDAGLDQLEREVMRLPEKGSA